jgi:acylaminoacyl-peptidase
MTNLIGVVTTPTLDDDGSDVERSIESEFPGIFTPFLPARPFLAVQVAGRDEEPTLALVFSTQWRSSVTPVLVKIDVEIKETPSKSYTKITHSDVRRLVPHTDRGHYDVLDVYGSTILLHASSPLMPSHPLVATVEDVKVPFEVVAKFQKVACANARPSVLEKVPSCKWEILTIQPEGTIGEHHSYEAIFLTPAAEHAGGDPKMPLVLQAHGGPHSCSNTSYSHIYAFLLSLGYAVLLVNYRGSTGFGSNLLQSLPGKCGTQDIKDVVQALQEVIKLGAVDADRVVYSGGSHGGFIGAHLLGQYPEAVQAAAIRNPAVSLSSMIGSTDIPDWCYVEAGLPLPKNGTSAYRAPNEEELVQMYRASASQYTKNIKAPVLLLIGAQDKRVPPSVGKEFYYALRAEGVKTKMLWYSVSIFAC